MRRALVDIGPAVFNGGFSTYLAFALLCFSNSYLFRSFFKVKLSYYLAAQKCPCQGDPSDQKTSH